MSSVEALGFSGYRRVVGRYTCVLHDVERSSLHIYDIDLVSGKSRQLYVGRGIYFVGLIASTLYLGPVVRNFGIEKVMTYEQTTGVVDACQKFC